jgi:ribosome-associated protein
MIRIARNLAIDESEIQEHFIQASGPGGQNINKVASAVQLRFDVANSPSLPDDVRNRLISLFGNRINQDGQLVIQASRFRNQKRNRDDAIERLVKLIQKAAQKPKIRRRTKPTLASKERRLESKHHSGQTKCLRKPVESDDE